MDLLSIAFAVAIGILFVGASSTLRGMRPRWAAVVFGISLGSGIGIGVTSVVFFLLLAVTGAPARPLIFATDGVCLIAAAALAMRCKPGPAELRPVTAPWTRALALLFVIVVIAVGARIVEMTVANPFGHWDAWAIWNLRAKYLAGPAGAWRFALSPLLTRTHPDYPLLVSGFVARVWRWSGATAPLAPAVTALIFFGALTGLLVSGVALLRGAVSGLLAGFVLLATLPMVWQAPSQCSDIPLAFYLLAAFALIFLDARSGSRDPWLLLCAGLCAGFGAWTKNEGIVFLIWILGAFCAAARRRRGLFLSGAAPALLLTLWVKFSLTPGSDLAQQSLSTALGKLHEIGRYEFIARWFARNIYHLGTGLGHPVVLLAILVVALRWQIEERYKLPIAITAVSLGLMCLTDAGVYLITPFDLDWHIETSMDRLIVQLWPSVLLLCFVVLRSYGESDGNQIC